MTTYSVSIDEITVPERLRTDLGDIRELAESISRLGFLIHPIVIDRDKVLISGERRLRACKSLGHDHIECRYFDELNELKKAAIEIEENLKRKQMSWQEERRSIVRIHELGCAYDPEWNQTKIGEHIGKSQQWVSERWTVHEGIKFDPEIENEPVFSTALRKSIVNGERRAKAELDGIRGPVKLKEVHQGDFCEWIKTYEGPPFNFIHCDFPYGIGADKRNQGNAITALGRYDDSRETNLTLLKALCDNLPRICADSAHIMFWFSMHYYADTVDRLSKHFKIDPLPLIWVKSPPMGLLPDPKRKPRQIYETCLFGSRGDRKILTPIANAHAGPIDGSGHPSAKPEKMLRHFFEMFVDETTRMLDPTCGSGTSLCAAESHHAEHILGIEIKEDYAELATRALEEARRRENDA
jgi:ParB/RepB/Spo0J family partition protein